MTGIMTRISYTNSVDWLYWWRGCLVTCWCTPSVIFKVRLSVFFSRKSTGTFWAVAYTKRKIFENLFRYVSSDMHLSVVAKFGVKWPSECLLNIVWFWGQKDSLCGTHHSRLFCPSISWTLSLLDLCTSAKFGPDWLRLAGVSPGRLIFRHPCIQAFSLHKQSVFWPILYQPAVQTGYEMRLMSAEKRQHVRCNIAQRSYSRSSSNRSSS